MWSEITVDLDKRALTYVHSPVPGGAAQPERIISLSPSETASLKQGINRALTAGIETTACVAEEAKHRPPDPPIDGSNQMLVRLASKQAYAPMDPFCWSLSANQVLHSIWKLADPK